PTSSAAPRPRSVEASDLGKLHSLLTLVFPFLVLVGDRRLFVAAKEENLGDPFVRVDLRGKGSGVRDFECDVPLPLGLEGRDVGDDAAARVRRLADRHGEYIARNAEVFDGARQR